MNKVRLTRSFRVSLSYKTEDRPRGRNELERSILFFLSSLFSEYVWWHLVYNPNSSTPAERAMLRGEREREKKKREGISKTKKKRREKTKSQGTQKHTRARISRIFTSTELLRVLLFKKPRCVCVCKRRVSCLVF